MINLHDYQEKAKEFIKSHPRCGLFLSMGLGKSLTTLVALMELGQERKLNGNILVIAPKNIARSTWIDEINKWNIPVNYKSLIVDESGKELKRDARMELYTEIPNRPSSMYFINREKISDLIKNTDDWYFPNIVIDESQSFKNYSSKRFKDIKTILPKTERIIELTGTPAPNGLMDLWSQIYLIDGGQRLGKNITAYRNQFFNPGRIMNGYPIEWIPKPGAEEYIYDVIKDVVISMKNTVLNLPDIIYNNETVYMEEDDEKLYKQLIKDFVLDFDDGNSVEIANAAVLTSKLSQIASGTLYINDEHEYKVIHDKKIERLKYIIDNTDDNILVAYHFQSEKEEIFNNLSNDGYNIHVFDGSSEMTKAWNNKEIPIMMIQPASAGHGINIQNGGHTLVWYTLSWSLEEYLQTNARLHRQGQNNTVIIHHILTAKTVDKRILNALNNKDTSQKALLNAVELTISDLS